MSEYGLKLSEAELERYRRMAEAAAEMEADLWAAAGVVEGATVADVGCGPGAVSAVLARRVGPAGSVRAVDQDPAAVEAARATAERAGVANVTVGTGPADGTGLPPGGADTVMVRHVLAHNGGREQAIVDHVSTLVRPGGWVYLVDVDAFALRLRPSDADLDDLSTRYLEWHGQQGNDLAVGLRLGELLAAAGLEEVQHHGRYQIFAVPPGARTPAWAGRDALVASGLAGQDDVERWEAAFSRLDRMQARPTVFVPQFVGLGRRPIS